MTLRWRLTAAITLLVGVTVFLAWWVSARNVQRLEEQVFDAFADQAVDVARRVEAGEDPRRVAKGQGLQVDVIRDPRAQRRVNRLARRAPPGEGEGLRVVERDGFTLLFPPGPRDRILVETPEGWVRVHREIDLQQPRQRLTWGLPVIGIVVVLLASLLAAVALRPLDTAREAMRRIAEGDLEHRLPTDGPSELATVAGSFNQMADRIEGLLRTERELLAGISHDLRTPLARLRLEIELLRDDGAPSKRLDAMERDLAELDGLITEVTELSKLQLGDRPLDVEDVDLRALADEVVAEAGLPHAVRVEGEGHAEVDRPLVRRALSNLLQNARRYVPEDAEVVVRVEPGALAVADRGPGVTDVERLFDPFWRGESSRNKATGGLGLGLMIVRQVAELHGGRATAANREGGGLEVRVQFAA